MARKKVQVELPKELWELMAAHEVPATQLTAEELDVELKRAGVSLCTSVVDNGCCAIMWSRSTLAHPLSERYTHRT
jgi:hypothetical protein